MRPSSITFAAVLVLAVLLQARAGGESTEAQGAAATTAPAEGGTADADPTRLIGLDLKSALSTLGVPQAVFPFRGDDETQDNVVFYYSDYLYLFWYQNRVWQVRCDRRFAHPVLGLALGMPRETIVRTFPRLLTANGDSLYFDVDETQYPIRVRLVFADGALSDVYVYRSDF